MRVRRVGFVAVFAAALALYVAAVASAATVTVGSPLPATGVHFMIGAPVTEANTALGEAGANVTSPVTGVVVRWRIANARGGTDALRVLTPGSGGSYTGAGRSSPQTPTADATQTYSTDLPISAGQTIGIDLSNNAPIGFASVSGSTGTYWTPPIPDSSPESKSGQFPNDEFTFNADVVAQPGVGAVTPASGPVSGGTHVVILGHDFSGATAVNFGTRAASSFSVDSDTQIGAVVPASATTGPADVTVTTLGGTSPASAADRFTYTPNHLHCVIPKLKGKTLSKARKLLSAAHCTLGIVAKPKHHHGKLVVKSQSPSAGAVLAKGWSVSVKLGPKPKRQHH